MNQTGSENLIKLQSEAADKCTYNGRYCCDIPMLEKYNEGLIVTTACLGGFAPNHIINGNIDIARDYILKLKEIFEDRLYLEIQPLDVSEQHIANIELAKLAKECNLKLVATNDVHYTLKEDYDDHDTLLCVGTGKKKDDIERMHYKHEFWVRSYDEMLDAFKRHTLLDESIYLEALENTNKIADRIDDDIKLGSDHFLFPSVHLPDGLTEKQFLTARSYENLYKYLKENPDLDRTVYEERLCEELRIINYKGYAPYFLSVFENIDFCEENDIPVGPGRGSASGSLVLFVNGGTKVADPIKYNLLFFRFLTEDRQAMPDVDSDFGYYGRKTLIHWLEDRHGYDKVCHIGTYSELGVKSGLKDFGRVLSIPFADVDKICKNIDFISDDAPGFKFKDMDRIANDIEDAKAAENNSLVDALNKKQEMIDKMQSEYPELFRLARRFEGTKRNMGVN